MKGCNVGSTWFPRILVEKENDFEIRFDLLFSLDMAWICCYYPRRATILTFELFWGSTNQDVLLTEACYYSRLYGKWVAEGVTSDPRDSS